MLFTSSFVATTFFAFPALQVATTAAVPVKSGHDVLSMLEKRQQQSPPVLIRMLIHRMSRGISDTISKYAVAEEVSGTLPTKPEVSQALKNAMQSVRADKPLESAQTIKLALDDLAEKRMTGAKGAKKLTSRQSQSTTGPADAKTTGTPSQPVTSPSGSITTIPSDSDTDQDAGNFMDDVTVFVHVKRNGGKNVSLLPTAGEIGKILRGIFEGADPNNLVIPPNMAQKLHQGMANLAAQKSQQQLGTNKAPAH